MCVIILRRQSLPGYTSVLSNSLSRSTWIKFGIAYLLRDSNGSLNTHQSKETPQFITAAKTEIYQVQDSDAPSIKLVKRARKDVHSL